MQGKLHGGEGWRQGGGKGKVLPGNQWDDSMQQGGVPGGSKGGKGACKEEGVRGVAGGYRDPPEAETHQPEDV